MEPSCVATYHMLAVPPTPPCDLFRPPPLPSPSLICPRLLSAHPSIPLPSLPLTPHFLSPPNSFPSWVLIRIRGIFFATRFLTLCFPDITPEAVSSQKKRQTQNEKCVFTVWKKKIYMHVSLGSKSYLIVLINLHEFVAGDTSRATKLSRLNCNYLRKKENIYLRGLINNKSTIRVYNDHCFQGSAREVFTPRGRKCWCWWRCNSLQHCQLCDGPFDFQYSKRLRLAFIKHYTHTR